MEQHRTSAEQWLETASADIRFRPDRIAVERELREHLEDKMADLTRLYPDLSHREAEAMALSQMGDPEEIGRELAKIHRPWLGYLWRLSQAVLACLLVLFLFRGGLAVDQARWTLWDFDRLPLRGGTLWDQGQMTAEELYLPGENPAQLMAESPSQSVKTRGYTVTLERAALWETSKQFGRLKLFVYLRVDSPRFWEKVQLKTGCLKVVDNLGHVYDLNENNWNMFENGFYCVEEGLFHQGWQLEVHTSDPDVRWVRLDYETDGVVFSFPIELKGVEKWAQ